MTAGAIVLHPGTQSAKPRDAGLAPQLQALQGRIGARPAGGAVPPSNNTSRVLTQFRDGTPACHLIAFVDLSSTMVLTHCARSKHAQERLDALAEQATELLTRQKNEETRILGPDHFVLFTPTGLTVFIRSGLVVNEALVLICALEVDLDTVLSQARQTLETIATYG